MKKLTRKKIILYIAIIVLIIAVVLISKVIKDKKERMEQFEVTPSTAVASITDIGIYIPASGTISSGNTVSVPSNTQGKVTEIYFKPGDFVNAGETIASIEEGTLTELIKTTQSSIDSKRSSIDQYDNETQEYTIKSTVKGRVKEINVKYVSYGVSEEYRQRAEDIEKEYGYLVAIALGNSMYIKVTENTELFEVGQEVDAVIHQSDGDQRVYSGAYVERIEEGTVYIYLDSNIYDGNVNADVYTSDGKDKIARGTTEYSGMEYIVGAKGYIEATSTYTNQLVNEGDILYYSYSNISQSLMDMYEELESLEEDMAELQEEYENLNITVPVSGFIESLNISEGDSVSTDSAVFTIADTSLWTATVSVDELDINSVDIGMPAVVEIDAIPDEEFVGTVQRISYVGTNSNGVTTYTVEIEIPSDERFKLNMNASSEIEVQKVESVVSVPIQAVRYQGNTAYVLIYADRTEEEIEEIKSQILDTQKAAEKISQMDQKEMQEYIAEMRNGKGNLGSMPEDGFSPTGIQDGTMPEIDTGDAGFGNMQEFFINTSNLNIAEQLYGEVVIVEVGIQDETNIEIISGLSAGDIVLLTTTESDSSSESAFSGPGGMSGFSSFGGMDGRIGAGPG
ncbi:MAG: HlyD family efflux transporter periplasmic adaptor subunit [Clostridia bacterium]|nr:HlyD family efflux transporter periplasmic adaptor subunit [Clostridia bacterium]